MSGSTTTPGFAGRRVRALVIRGDGDLLGCLPPIELPVPWWPETADLLAALRASFGLNALVLRLLTTSTPRLEPGADVTYAVELVGQLPHRLPLEPYDGTALGDDADPLRMPWARLGGVAADIAWADRQLGHLGCMRTGPVEQLKSWNLSLLLRMPTTEGTVWLKHVPPFMRHEAAVMRLVRQAGASVPEVLAADLLGRALLKEAPGEDAYDPDEPLAIQMVESFVALQERFASRRDAILATGSEDWSRATLVHEASRLAARDDLRADLELGEQAALDQLVGEMPTRLEALYECGLVDTLIHGDFHPGNYRTDGQRLVLLDWGDCGVGHPLFDMTTFLNGVPIDSVTRLRDAWNATWKGFHPAADVTRAAELVRPIAALRLASVYQRFLDGIEASEHVYHRADPPAWIRRAITLARNR